MGYSYQDIYKAIEFLWPNVIDVDFFIERLTDSQVTLLTAYLRNRVSSPRLQIIS